METMDTPKFIYRQHTLMERERILRVKYDYSPQYWCCNEKWSLYVTVATTPSGLHVDTGSTKTRHTYTFNYDNADERDKDLVIFREIADKNMKLYA